MVIEELTIKNWRGYRDSHTFRFEDGFNLVVGRNESGKSTLFEALTRILFDRHTSKTEEIRRMQPLGSSLGPEASLVFRTNGRRHKVVKRFLQQPICELYSDRGGGWERSFDGDKADNELRSILQGAITGRVVKPEHRGLAQALWYLQREEPLPEQAWTKSIKQGLSGLVQLVVKSPDEERIFNLVERNYACHFTLTGRVASGSELAGLQEEIPRMEEQLKDLHRRAEGMEQLRSDLEELIEKKTEKGLRLREGEAEVEEAKRDLEAANAVEEKKNKVEKTLGDIEERMRKLSSDQETISRRFKKVEELRKELEQAKEESDRLQADARQEFLAADRHHKKWKEEYEPNLQKIEADLLVLRSLERLHQLRKNEELLQEHLNKVSKVREELVFKKQELAKLYAPSKKEWTDFQENLSQLRLVEAQAEASAIRVGFDLKDKRAAITVNPEAQLTPENEFLVTAPTTFTILNIGKVRVHGGGASIEELNDKAKKLRNNIKATMDRFKVNDSQSLSDLYQKYVDLDREVKQLQKRMDELLGEGGKPEEELIHTRRNIENEKVKVEAASEEWKNLDDQKVREKCEDLEKEKKQVIKIIGEEQKNEKRANNDHRENMKKAQEASNRMVGLQSQIKSLEQENAEIIKTYGTMGHLGSLVTQTKGELRQAKDDLEILMKDYDVRVELPRKLYQQTLERVRNLETQLGKLEQEIVDRKARIEEAAAQSLYSQTADLEAELEVKRRRLETIKCRASAAKLLRDMILMYRKEQSAALVGPVAELVNRWLRLLTEDAYDSLDLNEEMLPVAVRSSRYSEPLPLESLSYGTHEQVIVLLRLAIGVLLSSKERNLVVIDDRLVNADAIRMKRLCLILQEVVTKSCQVVLATCNDTPYAGIKGWVIHIPSDGKNS